MKYKLNKLGFTLIEIMVVMAILGMMTLAAVGSYTASQKNSRDARRKTDLESIRQGLELYRSDNGYYPPGSVADVVCDTSVGVFASCTYGLPLSGTPSQDWALTSDVQTGLEPTYTTILPVDPQNTLSKYYYYEPVCNETTTVCGVSRNCTNRGCCAYEVGMILEYTGAKYSLCNP